MSGYDLKIRTKKRLHQETISFLQFLQRVGRKYPVNINYETIKEGNYVIRVDGAPGVSIDTLYQELILNKGLYYYKCSILKGDSLDIVRNVIIPIFQKLIELQFNYPQSRYLIRHIVGKPISDRKYILGDFQNTYSHEYEILMRKWDIKLLNDWEFIQD
jgi:hypothetical protein